MNTRTQAPAKAGTTNEESMKTIQIKARQCGKTAQNGELVMKPRSLGSSTLTVLAWQKERKQKDASLQPYQREWLKMLDHKPEGPFIRSFRDRR